MAQRRRRGVAAPHLTALRKVLHGQSYRRGSVESRGRKRKLTQAALRKINVARKRLIKTGKGEAEVHWAHVLKAARVRSVHPTTAARSLAAAGYDVAWRRPREKPLRTPEREAERRAVREEWRRRPEAYFTEKLDLVIDNKHFDIPTHAMARRYLKGNKVRGHLGTRGEGLEEGFTRPNIKRHRLHSGASINACAGIIGGSVRVLHFMAHRSTAFLRARVFLPACPPKTVVSSRIGF